MKAVVYHGRGDIRVDDVPDPTLEEPTDAVVRVTTAAICGTDLHFIRGTMPQMPEGRILGHEGVGVIEEVGSEVSTYRPGDRVLISAVLGCGSCGYCRHGHFAQCDVANPLGPRSGTASFGSPVPQGPFNGLQAEYARVPFARTNLFGLPDSVSDAQAIPLSDIYPTGYFGAVLSGVSDGQVAVVWGCGPVGQFAVRSAFQRGAGRVIAVDGHPDRLEHARLAGAETVDFTQVDPVEAVMDMTGGAGADCAIDAVGVDAQSPSGSREETEAGRQWTPGDAPAQVNTWSIQSLRKMGTLGIVGVYPADHSTFPIGTVLGHNLTVRAGNGNHPRYIPRLLDLVRSGVIDPEQVLTQHTPLTDAVEAYRQFDLRSPGWLKVALATA